jgi:hypothetical protein
LILQEVSACPPEKSYTSKEIVWGARFCHKSVLDRVGMINITLLHVGDCRALSALLADDNRFGFIVMDGNGALFGTLQVMKKLLRMFKIKIKMFKNIKLKSNIMFI